VPTHLPYVVSLVRFYETDSAVYLQLQHAPGGQLWSYVGAYLSQCSDATANFEQCRLADDATVSANKDRLRSDRSNSDTNLNFPASADSITTSATCAESEELDMKSKLSSDLDSVDEFRESIGRQVSTTSSAECSSHGFGEVLRSTNSALKYFRIDSSDSSGGHTSRQVSCGSAEDSFCRIHSAPLSSGSICRYCSEAETPQPATCSNSGAGSPDETSIYDVCHGNTVDKQAQELGRSSCYSLANEGTDHLPKVETNRSRHSTVRSNSQERCNSDSYSSRRRRRTLSSAFGELDLAESTYHAGSTALPRPLVHLPESCVQQWAAEMVVAISRLHSIGIICRQVIYIVHFSFLIDGVIFVFVLCVFSFHPSTSAASSDY